MNPDDLEQREGVDRRKNVYVDPDGSLMRKNTKTVAVKKAGVETTETAFAGLASIASTWLLMKTGMDFPPELLVMIGTLAYKFLFKYVRDLMKKRLA